MWSMSKAGPGGQSLGFRAKDEKALYGTLCRKAVHERSRHGTPSTSPSKGEEPVRSNQMKTAGSRSKLPL